MELAHEAELQQPDAEVLSESMPRYADPEARGGVIQRHESDAAVYTDFSSTAASASSTDQAYTGCGQKEEACR
jgi:hypothetical protein